MSEPQGGVWQPPLRSLTIGLTLTVSFAAAEALAVATVVPALTRELGGLRLYGWVFSAFILAQILGLVVGGTEADRVGPARPFGIGIALFTAGLLAGGAAPSMSALVAARAIQGFGAGGIFAAAYAVIGSAYPADKKATMVAIFSSAWVVPGFVGPPLAGFVADRFGWRWVFLGLAPLPPLASMMVVPALRRNHQDRQTVRESNRFWSACRLTIGFGAVLTGLGVGLHVGAIPLLVGGAALAAPALRRLMPEGTLVARPGLPAAIALIGLVNTGFFGADAFVPLTVTAVLGRSATEAGLALTTATLGWTAGAWAHARLHARTSRALIAGAGLALIAAAICGLTAVQSLDFAVVVVAVVWGVGGLGMGLAYTVSKVAVLQGAPTGAEGRVTSAMQLADVLGGAAGPGIGGAIVSALARPPQPPRAALTVVYAAMLVIVCLAGAVAVRLGGRPRSNGWAE